MSSFSNFFDFEIVRFFQESLSIVLRVFQLYIKHESDKYTILFKIIKCLNIEKYIR